MSCSMTCVHRSVFRSRQMYLTQLVVRVVEYVEPVDSQEPSDAEPFRARASSMVGIRLASSSKSGERFLGVRAEKAGG